MNKFLFWLLVILAVLLVTRLLAHHKKRQRQVRPVAPPPQAPAQSQAMVACAHCGVFVPAHEALRHQGKTWCSAEHARRGSQ